MYPLCTHEDPVRGHHLFSLDSSDLRDCCRTTPASCRIRAHINSRQKGLATAICCGRSARLGLAVGGRRRMRRAGDSWLSSPAALAVNGGSLERLASLGDAEMREPRPRLPGGASLVRADAWSAPRDRLRYREPGRAGQSGPHRRRHASAEYEGWTAITGGPFGGGSSPPDEACSGPFCLLGTSFPQDCGCGFAPAVVGGPLPDQLTGWRES